MKNTTNIRREMLDEMLQDAKKVYDGPYDREYIKRQLDKYIGRNVNLMAESGCNEYEMAQAVAAAKKHARGYRTIESFVKAVIHINDIFNKYDRLEEDEDNLYDLIMNAKRSDIKTETFYLNDGYYMDAVTNNIEHTFEFYIYHESCGIKMLMFGVPQSQQDYDDAVEIAFYNTEEYIEVYDEEYNF